MNEFSILKAPSDIAAKLSIFGVTKKELAIVAVAAASARNNATRLHPINSPGTFAYHEGVAALRLLFLTKAGWDLARPNGIEVVENQSLGLTIIFQNVDNACGVHDPKPSSDKGEGMKKFVDNPTRYLWDYMENEDKNDENKHVWFFCVAVNGEKVKAELSRPKSIDGTQFGLFMERIFIINDDDWSTDGDISNNTNNEQQDFEINVSKKL